MKTFIHRDNISKVLKENGWNFFGDEGCRLVDVENISVLFTYKYFGFDDIWSFWIENEKLFCESIGGMMVVFPLHS